MTGLLIHNMKRYAFDKIWFQDNQKWLLKLLNNPFTKRWFRYVLRIRKDDCKLSEKISAIEPNNYRVDLGLKWTKKEGVRHYYRADFRTHNKYSKRIYHAFYFIWLAMHTWDTLFANRYAPQLNLGFDTLTVYPDASPETTSVDGYTVRDVSGTPETWSDLRAGSANGAVDNDANIYIGIFAKDASGEYYLLRRGIFLFDTSSLDSGATISSTVFSLYITSSGNQLGASGVGVVSSNPASNTAVATGDHTSLGTTRYATDLAFASMASSQYNDITLNSSGISAIAKDGITKLGVRIDLDLDNTTPTWGSYKATEFNVRGAEQTGTSADPKLVVTYTVVSGPANVKTYKGLAAASVKSCKGLAIASVKTKKGLN